MPGAPTPDALGPAAPGFDAPGPETPTAPTAERPDALPEPLPPAEWKILESVTRAPTIGKVLSTPTWAGAPAVPFRVSNVSLDSVLIGGFHVAAGSMVGAGHLANGSPRQDAYDFAATRDGRLVVAIADGMGSRPNSQVGSRLFCETVIRLASLNPCGSAAEFLITAQRYAAGAASRIYDLSPDDISFVGAVAVLGPHGYEIARVGDVSAFVVDPAAPFHELYPTDHGHVNIVTHGLPSAPDPVPELATGAQRHPLVLVTDGIANDLRTSDGVRTWLLDCWASPIDAFAMAEALRYRRRGSHDDRTAIVVSFGPAENGS